jgi:hypothetical protein
VAGRFGAKAEAGVPRRVPIRLATA